MCCYSAPPPKKKNKTPSRSQQERYSSGSSSSSSGPSENVTETIRIQQQQMYSIVTPPAALTVYTYSYLSSHGTLHTRPMPSIIRSIPTYKAYVAVVIWGSWPGQSHVTPAAIGLLERGSLLHADCLCVYLYLCAVPLVLHCLESEKKKPTNL